MPLTVRSAVLVPAPPGVALGSGCLFPALAPLPFFSSRLTIVVVCRIGSTIVMVVGSLMVPRLSPLTITSCRTEPSRSQPAVELLAEQEETALTLVAVIAPPRRLTSAVVAVALDDPVAPPPG